MKKRLILTFAITTIVYAHAQERYDHLTEQFGNNTVFKECIEEYKNAFDAFEPYKNNVKVQMWIEASGKNVVTRYDYECETKEIEELLKNYQIIKNILPTKTFMNAFGNGFIIGILAAGINRILSPKKINKKMLAVYALATIGTIACQHKGLPNLSYFDDRLKLHNNIFTFNNTAADYLGALLSSGISLLGTTYLINKIGSLYHVYKTK